MKKPSTIKAAQIQSGKTQLQVAKEIGISIRLYQKYENNEVLPNVIVGNKIAKALNVTSDELWRD